MKKEFYKLPVVLYDGAANYLFFRTPEITDLDKQLEGHGIMIRNCSNYENLGRDYWRVAVKAHEENKKLIKAFLCFSMVWALIVGGVQSVNQMFRYTEYHYDYPEIAYSLEQIFAFWR